jgi:hypothetical protein
MGHHPGDGSQRAAHSRRLLSDRLTRQTPVAFWLKRICSMVSDAPAVIVVSTFSVILFPQMDNSRFLLCIIERIFDRAIFGAEAPADLGDATSPGFRIHAPYCVIDKLDVTGIDCPG